MRTDELRMEATQPGPGQGSSTSGSPGNGSSPGGTTGADRFWGEFSRTRAGRSNPGSTGNGSGGERRESSAECLDWCPVCRSADLIRGSATPDLLGQLEAIQGEALNVMRAFLSAYAEKSGETGGTPRSDNGGRPSRGESGGPVDIPIE